MKTGSTLTQKEFDELLRWLDADPARAGEKYEAIRRRLIWFYLSQPCPQAEELTDETINRVAQKPQEWKEAYVGERMPYFYAVARNVFREHCRELNRKIESPPETSDAELNPYRTCLKICLAKLSEENRSLILSYYQERKKAKIDSHKAMGNKMGLNPGALRARIHRIRTRVRECVEECVGNLRQSNDINSGSI
jgi:RNA polymerase sigma factor (sigma-70 family)